MEATEKKNVFEELGIYGLTHQTEVAILAALACGDPAILIGPPGCGKTEVLGQIGAALREYSRLANPNNPDKHFRYRIYDSSKLNWEDLVGFPNIKKITDEGVLDFINTGTTIWGAHLVVFDELNRCREDRQSNLFEVIRNRRLHGIPTDTRFVFGAMNPHGDTGTEMMSEALVDRFMFYIHFGGFMDMGDSDRVRIIQRVGGFDAIGKKTWAASSNVKSKADYQFDLSETSINENLAHAGKLIRQVMESAVEIYDELEDDCGREVAELINKTCSHLHSLILSDKKAAEISARRASMIYRGCLSYRSVELALSRLTGSKLNDMEGSIINAFHLALPQGISGSLKEDDRIRVRKQVSETVRNFWSRISGTSDGIPTDIIYELYITDNPFRKLDILTSYPIKKMESKNIWAKLAADDSDQDVQKIIYLLSTTTDLVPQNVEVKDFEDEFRQPGDIITRLTLCEELSRCKEDIDLIEASVKSEPIAHFIFSKALDSFNKTVTSPATAYECIHTLRSLSKGLKNKLERLKNENAASNQSNSPEAPVVP